MEFGEFSVIVICDTDFHIHPQPSTEASFSATDDL